MRAFHMILLADSAAAPRRVDFFAESHDHAFQVARNETNGIVVELWDDEALLARMTKSGDNLWKLHASESPVAANQIFPSVGEPVHRIG
ncbi:hypothetical protein [Sphingopyxis fribergensis]